MTAHRINKRPTPIQRVLTRGYRESQKILDPLAYTQDSIKIARAELDARHEFYVVPDINKSQRLEPDNHDNLTDEERERWFGKSHLHPDDVTWEKLENILVPTQRPGAVIRVNGALNGSHNNERFSIAHHSTSPNRAGYTEAQYTPRTVSAYDSREQAMVAAKILRILTKDDTGKGSVASVLAEGIENGNGQPVWVVSDNMNLQTHNALRLYFTNQAHKLSPEERIKHRQECQRRVNDRLLPGERWDSLEGVPTLLTLQGRPGVKMYKSTAKGGDDAADIAHLSRIPKQALPRIVKGVPHDQVIASDGRPYFDPGDTFATVACLLVGPKGYAFLRTGNTKVIGELMSEEANFIKRPLHAGNTFALGHHISEAVTQALTVATDKVLSLSAGSAAVLLHGSAIAAGTSFYSVFKRVTGSDPLKNRIKEMVEERCGPLEETKLFKVWEPRTQHPAMEIQSEDLAAPAPKHDIDAPLATISSPLGDIILPEKLLNSLSPADDFGHGLSKYMRKNRLWPNGDSLQEQNKLPDKFFDNNGSFYNSRDGLAAAFGNWLQAHYLANGSTGEEKTAATDQLAGAMNDLDATLQKYPKLPADTANKLQDLLRKSLTDNIHYYLETRVKSAEPRR